MGDPVGGPAWARSQGPWLPCAWASAPWSPFYVNTKRRAGPASRVARLGCRATGPACFLHPQALPVASVWATGWPAGGAESPRRGTRTVLPIKSPPSAPILLPEQGAKGQDGARGAAGDPVSAALLSSGPGVEGRPPRRDPVLSSGDWGEGRKGESVPPTGRVGLPTPQCFRAQVSTRPTLLPRPR